MARSKGRFFRGGPHRGEVGGAALFCAVWGVLIGVIGASGGAEARGEAPSEIPLHEWALPRATDGAVRARRAPEPAEGVLADVRLGRGRGAPWKAELTWTLPPGFSPRSENWHARYELEVQVRLDPGLVSASRHHRARLFLIDSAGRRQYLPNRSVGGTEAWTRLSGRPVSGLPVPLGFTDEGFRTDQIRALGVNFEAGGRNGELRQGTVQIRGLRFLPTRPEDARDPLPRDSTVVAGERGRAQQLAARWRELYGVAPGERLVPGVNLAWASARSPDGKLLQLYGSFIHAAEPWYGVYWDLARNPDVVASVRADFAAVRRLFGPRAIVRVFLFAAVTSGIEFNESGIPTRIHPLAYASIDRLFQLAREEEVTLMPTVFDFLMADGLLGPPVGGNAHWVGEVPHLITDPEARRATVKLIGALAARYRNEPALLAWDVMNEPENAVAVVTPEHFASLQTFLRDSVEAIQAEGVLGTVGHRNPFDARDYFRGVVPSSLGQVHYYPVLETRPAPFALSWALAQAFGPVPCGWGELPARPGVIERDLRATVQGGSAYSLYWSWRGDDENGDGFAVRAYSEEIRGALPRVGALSFQGS